MIKLDVTLTLQTKPNMLEGVVCDLISSFMTNAHHTSMKTTIFRNSKHNLYKRAVKTHRVHK